MNCTFITICRKCGEEFAVFWAIDRKRVGSESLADVTCPVCGKRSNQSANDLLPYSGGGRGLLTSRPVRSVEIAYDCPHCGNSEILVSLVHTDLPWEDVSREGEQTAVCNNFRCPRKGLLQKLMPTRVLSGALNPGWE